MSEIEIEFEDTKRGVKFRLKGSPEMVESYLKKYGYDSAMKEATNRQQSSMQAKPLKATSNKYEEIQIPDKPKAESLTQYIVAMMYSPWGSPGRTSTELQEVAGIHGIAIPMSTLSGILNALIKSGKLRRAKHPGEKNWKYSQPISIVTGRE